MSIKRYAVDGTDTNTASTTLLGITSTTTVRPAVYDFTIGCDTTPADQAANYLIQRYTAAGTSTAVTPQAIDPASPSALSSAGEAHSVEPTYTSAAILFSLALNQRATYRWVAAPGSELVMPASANNGLGWLSNAVTSAFANCRVSALYME